MEGTKEVRMEGKRDRRLEDWVELAAAAVERARRSLGDDEVARRVEASVTDEDYETVVRVLRTMGRDLQSTGPDLSALDARLRGAGHVEHHPHVPESPEDAATGTTEADAVPGTTGADAVPGTGGSVTVPRGPADASGTPAPEQNPEPSLDDLPPHERGAVRPAELAKRLARLRNPILPHPRRGRGV